jgi:uncharacterized protein YukE
MDFKASCGELSNIGSQLSVENENIVSNIVKIENAIEQLRSVWKDGSSETYCNSLSEYVKSISQIVDVYNTIGAYAVTVSNKYDYADNYSAQVNLSEVTPDEYTDLDDPRIYHIDYYASEGDDN